VQIDVFTVLTAVCAVIVLLGLQLLFFWFQDQRAKWLGWWAGLFLAAGVGIGCFIFRDIEPDLIGVRLSNASTVLAFAFAWQGTRVFERRKPKVLVALAAPVLWLALCAWPTFQESLQLRVLGASLISATFMGLGAFELWRGRAERLASRKVAIFMFGSVAMLFLLRIVFLDLLPFPLGGMEPTAAAVGIFNLVIFAHATSLTMLMVAMTKERLESEQRTFALYDPLTGLLNRRAFQEQTERMARQRLGREPLAMLVLDLDHFKDINDRYGHSMGDRVLASFGDVARANIRPADLFYRVGGEEFCCILPNASATEAFRVAERIRRAFQATLIDGRSAQISVTVSVGVASSEMMGFDLDALYGSADAAVYAAKAQGRNKSVMAGSAMSMRTLASATIVKSA
jgi:diguanylate cyclase (GGDEF)-like protein